MASLLTYSAGDSAGETEKEGDIFKHEALNKLVRDPNYADVRAPSRNCALG